MSLKARQPATKSADSVGSQRSRWGCISMRSRTKV